MKNTIVIAEDEPITRMDVCEILTEAGYDIVGQASNGVDAVELCRKHKPDLAIMDIKMPHLDGLKATKLVVNEELVDAVILLTSYSGSEFIDEAKEAGVMAYIVKPIDERRLIPEVEIAISKGKEIKKMKNDVIKAREQIEKRKMIDIAKKILIRKYCITEDEAYKRIRKESMNSRSTVLQVAISIIEGQ